MSNRESKKVIKRTSVGEGPNGEDILKTILVSANGEEIVVKEEVVVESETFPEVQEEGEVPEQKPIVRQPSNKLRSAAELTELAEERREDSVRGQKNILLNEIFNGCMEHLLEGAYVHNFPTDSPWNSLTIKAAISTLKEQGYKVKKTPKPGKGFDLEIRWPTKSKNKKNKKKSGEAPPKAAAKKTQKKIKQEVIPAAPPPETVQILSPEELEEAKLRDAEFRRKGRERIKKARAESSE